ncbi:MAG: NADP-dependent oxidoreductase [Candidatus Saccharimonadales bacterium]
MKAAQIQEYGGPSVVTVVDAEKPVVKAGQILVEVHAASLNPFDTTIREGYMKDMIPIDFPATLGGDIAGTVVEIGDGVDTVAIGDNVYGQANIVAGNSGAFAEYAATAAGQVAIAPTNVSITEAAALPLVGVSAMQAVHEHIALKANQKILIIGGGGGIGRVAIQVAKHLGAYVATTASGEGIEIATTLGADEVIDYTSQDFTELLHDFDAAFDTAGGDEFAKALSILKQGGIAVTMTAQFDEAQAKDLGITAIAQMTHVTTAVLDQLRELVEADVVKPYVGKEFSLDEVQEAFTARESGTVDGKVVLNI